VFIDEAAAKTNMVRLYGWGPRGERLHAHAPAGHWNTTTMISSVRLDGTTACMTVKGAADTEVFRTYVQEFLLPTLRPGDVVVMDNLRAHKSAPTIALIQSAGAEVRFLPPYSPDLNPIEKMWSKVKTSLRRTAARTHEKLLEAIAAALDSVSSKDARGWFDSCGYNIN